MGQEAETAAGPAARIGRLRRRLRNGHPMTCRALIAIERANDPCIWRFTDSRADRRATSNEQRARSSSALMRRRDPCRESGSDHCRIREPPTARGAGVPKREGHLYCTLHLDAVQQPEPRTRTHHRFAPRCASDDRMTASAKFPLHAPQQCRNPLVNANSSCLETSMLLILLAAPFFDIERQRKITMVRCGSGLLPPPSVKPDVS